MKSFYSFFSVLSTHDPYAFLTVEEVETLGLLPELNGSARISVLNLETYIGRTSRRGHYYA